MPVSILLFENHLQYSLLPNRVISLNTNNKRKIMTKQKNAVWLLLLLIIGFSGLVKAQLIHEVNKNERHYIPSSSVSNHYYIWTTGMWNINGTENIKSNVKHQISEKESVSYRILKKGKRLKEKRRTISKYNNDGRLLNSQSFRSGKEKRNNILAYNADGFFTSYKRFARGEFKDHEIITYDHNNNVLKYDLYKGDKFVKRWKANYNDTLIISQWSYKKDTSEIQRKWEYGYYKGKQKKETKFYKKGALKHTWSYTCDEEGKEIKPKEETQICELKQYNNDGSYVVIQRRTGKKGKISKSRISYDKENRLIMREEINVKGKITSKQSYKYDENNNQTAWYYYKRGKKSDDIRWGKETVFNEAGKKLEERHIGKKGKAYGSYKHTYNAEDLLTSSVYIDLEDDEIVSRYEYKYNVKGLRVENLRYNKKNVLVNQYKTTYQYY